MYRDTTNVEPEMYDYTSNNWSHWNSNEKLKEKCGSCSTKTFRRFTTKDNYSWNIKHNTGSTAVWNLKPERWGSPLVQEKHQGEKAFEKKNPYNNNNNMLIMIFIAIRHFNCYLQVLSTCSSSACLSSHNCETTRYFPDTQLY